MLVTNKHKTFGKLQTFAQKSKVLKHMRCLIMGPRLLKNGVCKTHTVVNQIVHERSNTLSEKWQEIYIY